MKRAILLMTLFALIGGMTACGGKQAKNGKENGKAEQSSWIVDSFDDMVILRYEVPGFDDLELDEKLFVYYMSQAALCGRDMIYDQNCRYNLPIRRTLEAIYADYSGERESEEWTGFEEYLKKIWYANGIHHLYSFDKFQPAFSAEYFDMLIENTPETSFPDDFGSVEELLTVIKPVMFDPAVMPVSVNQKAGEDLLLTSAMNYYEGVTEAEATAFYNEMARKDPNNKTTPIHYGLNNKLVKEDGKLVERVWKVGGMYTQAIEQVVRWLELAKGVANPIQASILEKLIAYYHSGDLEEFDEFNIAWVQDTISKVDYINGFTEVYGDPLGLKASWESIVNFKNEEASIRSDKLSASAQWFEDNSPIDDRFKKEEVKGVSAKVITVAMLGGDCHPSTPIGVNLPNSDWIRKEYGSKSVTIQNITDAYGEGAKGDGTFEEFVLREEDRKRISKFGGLSDNLHTDMHECLGHGSGQLLPGVAGDALGSYQSALEETRADLFALYFMADPKMIEIGLIPSLDVAWAQYSSYVINGMQQQLHRVELGKDIEQTHMRNRQLISTWCYEKGLNDNVIEKLVVDGKSYIVVNDFDKLRELFGELLKEVQHIKSTGDYKAGKQLVENYGIKVDQEMHKEVLDRYAVLGVKANRGFVNPSYHPVMENGEIVDVKIEYETNFAEQMMEYSKNYSFLPCKN